MERYLSDLLEGVARLKLVKSSDIANQEAFDGRLRRLNDHLMECCELVDDLLDSAGILTNELRNERVQRERILKLCGPLIALSLVADTD